MIDFGFYKTILAIDESKKRLTYDKEDLESNLFTQKVDNISKELTEIEYKSIRYKLKSPVEIVISFVPVSIVLM